MMISPSSGVESNAVELTASATRSTTSMCSSGKPSSIAASAISCGSSARGFGGRQQTRLPTSSRPSRAREHLVRILLAQQTDDERARRGRELLGERAAQASRAGDVVRAVEQHERLPADDLEPARRPHARERVGDDVDVERRADERLGRRQRDRGVVGLVRAVQREEHIGIRAHRA